MSLPTSFFIGRGVGGGPVDFSINFLVIGGGGGGGDGNASGGAGGAGTLVEVSGDMTTDENILFTATAGQGGQGSQTNDYPGSNGFHSRLQNSISTLDVIAYGGGRGASYNTQAEPTASGGSGGGGAGPSNNNPGRSAGNPTSDINVSYLTNASVSSYANAGGNWTGGGSYGYGGGGGGAGGSGASPTRGAGRVYSWMGPPTEYASGGTGAGTEVNQHGARVASIGSGGGGLADAQRQNQTNGQSDGYPGGILIRVPDTVILSDIALTSGPSGYTSQNLNSGGYNNYLFYNFPMNRNTTVETDSCVYTFKISPA